MKNLIFIIFVLMLALRSVGQEVYDFESVHVVTPEEANSVIVLPSIKLYQNIPNPVKENTHIDFRLSTPGMVSLELFDLLGNLVSSLLNENMKAGSYSIPVEIEKIPNGIYFYVLKKEGDSRSMKMIVSK